MGQFPHSPLHDSTHSPTVLVQPGDYLLLRLPPKLDLPPALTKLLIEPTASKYLNSITRTDRETSLVLTLPEEVSTSTVEHLQELQDVQIDSDWKCLRIRGPMQFDLVGVMAEVSKTLSKAQISLFATSTWSVNRKHFEIHVDKRQFVMIKQFRSGLLTLNTLFPSMPPISHLGTPITFS